MTPEPEVEIPSPRASRPPLPARLQDNMLKKLNLYLIKPSNYDEDGYVIRHWRGVLPSNTLACLAGLTEDVLRQNGLGESLEVNVQLLDEAVDFVPVKRICNSAAPA